MPPVIKKPCVNNNNFSYSGKECSPLGKGYTADAEQVGTIMEGRDTTMWMVGIKNGVKVWNRVPTDLAKDTAEIANPSKDKEEVLPSPKKEPVVATKKKTPAKKAEKKPVVQVSESEDEPDEVKDSTQDPSDKEDEPPAKLPLSPIKEVKKAPSKKKVKEEKTDDKPVEKEKKTRKPTDFNIFMSYQIKILTKENPTMSHKDKFTKVASQWKELSESEKKEVLMKAKADKE